MPPSHRFTQANLVRGQVPLLVGFFSFFNVLPFTSFFLLSSSVFLQLLYVVYAMFYLSSQPCGLQFFYGSLMFYQEKTKEDLLVCICRDQGSELCEPSCCFLNCADIHAAA